jgi:hypothetical protein
VRRMNLILHGVDEQPDEIRGNQERMEKDKARCEKIFKAIQARTKKDDLRFCRRIGERGAEPRPIVVGLENEEEKRHILGRARELRNTRFKDVSIVPDLTRKQRNREARMKDEAEEKNKSLTAEERSRNIKWLVVGRRGEKRIIKGVERDQHHYSNSNREPEYERRAAAAPPAHAPAPVVHQQQPVVPLPVGRTQPLPQLGPRLLPTNQEQRDGRWYSKERDDRDLGARPRTSRWSENPRAGERDQRETRNSRPAIIDARHATKRTRWSGTSSEEEDRQTRQRR